MTIRDRVKELRRVRAANLHPHPKNWRTHSPAQRDAMRGILAEIGYAGAALAYESDGRLVLIDGHMRQGLDSNAEIPVLVLDVDDQEAEKLLLTFDPIAAMAEADKDKLDSLLREVQTGDEALASMLEGLAEENGIIEGGPVELKQLPTQAPPAMSWVLIGIPTVRYGEIAADMERIGVIDGIVLETTVNNG